MCGENPHPHMKGKDSKMLEELEYEFSQFKKDFNNENFTYGMYLDELDYEDEYSHNEIYEYQEKLIKKIEDFLHENAPDKYIVDNGWCVLVMSIEEAKKRNWYHYELRIVK